MQSCTKPSIWSTFHSWWRHQMEAFSALLAIVRGSHRSPVISPHKGQWRGSLMFSLICVWINGWVNNGDAGDLRRHRSHYDVTVMFLDVNDSYSNRQVIHDSDPACLVWQPPPSPPLPHSMIVLLRGYNLMWAQHFKCVSIIFDYTLMLKPQGLHITIMVTIFKWRYMQ